MSPDPEAAYYQAVEEFFVSRRGDPLFLSNADWLLIRKWRKSEIPLRVVFRGIKDALDGHAVSWSRNQRVGSLSYCANEVEIAHDRWRRALDLGREPGTDVAAGVHRLAAALRAARNLGPRAAAEAHQLATDLAAAGTQHLSVVEDRLAAAEASLVAAIEREDGPEVVAEIGDEVGAILDAYRGRMPAPVLAQISADSKRRRLLERHGLPRLSLFHLDGVGGSPPAEPPGRGSR